MTVIYSLKTNVLNTRVGIGRTVWYRCKSQGFVPTPNLNPNQQLSKSAAELPEN